MSEQTEEFEFEVERYELREAPRYRFRANRREFTQIVGAGVIVAVSATRASAQRRAARREEFLSQRFHLGSDGNVTVLTSKVEVGQGSRTQITQAVAEELNLSPDRIKVVMADTELCPDDGGTAGSRTTPSTVPRVRNAAAALRELLSRAASDRLGVPAGKITLANGIFQAGQQRVTIAEFAVDDQLASQLGVASPRQDESIHPVDDWTTLGTSIQKVGGREIVTGAARYPSDIQRPGMLYGKVVRPPSYGAELSSVDLNAVSSMEGVAAVRDGDFVGCVASSSWQASKAVDAIRATTAWNEKEHVSNDQLFEHFKRTATTGGRNRDQIWGSPDPALANALHTIDSRYTVAYIQHAPMEPRTAVAEWNQGKLTVWTGSQQPSRVQSELCQAFRLSADRVRVIIPDTGGGFGGKHTGEAAVECARLAKACEKPVSLRWTREEEFTWAYFRPAGLIEVKAGLDSSGNLTAWEFTNYNSGGSAIATPYRVPHGKTSFKNCDSPLRQGSYRALASTANTFARESAMDELAELAKIDPLEFRLAHLDDGRLKDVLKAVADRFEWRSRSKKTNPNRGVGIACGTEKGSFVAACAEVEVVDGQLKVLEVCQAYECGAVQNPQNLESQHTGAIIMGLGGALYEQIQFAGGRVTNPSFSAYRVPRMRDVPKIDLLQLDRKDLPSVGAGETPIIAVAPAIANAFYQASGVRERSMPMARTG